MPRPRHRHKGRQAAEALVRTAPLVSRWIERLLAGHEPPLTVAQYLALQAVDEGEQRHKECAWPEWCLPEPCPDRLEQPFGGGDSADQKKPGDEYEGWPGLPGRGYDSVNKHP